MKFFSRQWILPFSPVCRSRPAELKTAQENTFKDFPGGSDGKVSAYIAGDPGSIPGLGRAPRKGNGNHSSTLAWKIPWTEEPGRLHSPWGRKESDTTERLHFHFKENPYMCWSCWDEFHTICGFSKLQISHWWLMGPKNGVTILLGKNSIRQYRSKRFSRVSILREMECLGARTWL